MAKSEAVRFIDDITSGKLSVDSSEILGKGSHSEMHEYAKSFGYDFTSAEMLEVVNEKNLISEGDLTEDQMKAMVGGGKSVIIPVVVSVVVDVVVTASASAAAACL